MDRGPNGWGDYTYARVAGLCMAPGVREGSWVGIDDRRAAMPGDLVAVRDGTDDMLIAALAEWLGQRWLVTAQCPPRPLDGGSDIVGVVALIVRAL